MVTSVTEQASEVQSDKERQSAMASLVRTRVGQSVSAEKDSVDRESVREFIGKLVLAVYPRPPNSESPLAIWLLISKLHDTEFPPDARPVFLFDYPALAGEVSLKPNGVGGPKVAGVRYGVQKEEPYSGAHRHILLEQRLKFGLIDEKAYIDNGLKEPILVSYGYVPTFVERDGLWSILERAFNKKPMDYSDLYATLRDEYNTRIKHR